MKMKRARRATQRTLTALARGATVGLLALMLASTGCSASQTTVPSSASSPGGGSPVELNISAAATLKNVLAKVAPSFERTHGVKLVINYGASGVLMKQIEAGAPADVFLSASPVQVNTLAAEGIISADTTMTFAGNDLVILVAKGNPKGIHGPGDLAKAVKITTGDPATAPHGTKAKEWLTGLGLWNALLPKIVYTANAAQTDDFVARGEVDAGIGFASDAKGRNDVEVAYTVPAGQIKPVRYVAAPIKVTSQAELASQFVTYMLSPEVQSALVKAGFKAAPSQ
jgi:molybdate transport system substrate-binding protein